MLGSSNNISTEQSSLSNNASTGDSKVHSVEELILNQSGKKKARGGGNVQSITQETHALNLRIELSFRCQHACNSDLTQESAINNFFVFFHGKKKPVRKVSSTPLQSFHQMKCFFTEISPTWHIIFTNYEIRFSSAFLPLFSLSLPFSIFFVIVSTRVHSVIFSPLFSLQTL